MILGTGAPSAIDQGLACLENGATFVVFAVPAPGVDHPMPLNDLWRREVTVRTAYGAAPADLAMAMELIATERVVGREERRDEGVRRDRGGRQAARAAADATTVSSPTS